MSEPLITAIVTIMLATNGLLVYLLKRKASPVPSTNDDRCRVNGERIAKLETEKDHALSAISELKKDVKDSFCTVFDKIDALTREIRKGNGH